MRCDQLVHRRLFKTLHMASVKLLVIRAERGYLIYRNIISKRFDNRLIVGVCEAVICIFHNCVLTFYRPNDQLID